MKARLLVMHRTESYEGEFLPEVVGIVDEVTLDENPKWWTEEVARIKGQHGNDVAAWAEVDLPTEAVLDALYPKQVSVPVTVTAPA